MAQDMTFKEACISHIEVILPGWLFCSDVSRTTRSADPSREHGCGPLLLSQPRWSFPVSCVPSCSCHSPRDVGPITKACVNDQHP
eukprot:5037763-Amphidinium_carterae.1